jgi:hypothetical protein
MSNYHFKGFVTDITGAVPKGMEKLARSKEYQAKKQISGKAARTPGGWKEAIKKSTARGLSRPNFLYRHGNDTEFGDSYDECE